MNTPFGSWPSPLTAQELTRGVTGFADLQCAANALFLLESRPEEAGRNTLLMLNPEAPEKPGTELSPAPLNVRSRVHEYGGGAFLATEHTVFFVNFADQNIYLVDLEKIDPESVDSALEPTPPRQLTFSEIDRRYADLALAPGGSQLIAVCEQHSDANHEPENFLVCIDLQSGAEQNLHSDHDFYAAPRVCQSSGQLAFVAWDHPAMPWDTTVLYQARIDDRSLVEVRQIEGGSNESITQPGWLQDQRLLFASDRNGFWNLHVRPSPRETDAAHCLQTESAEYASPAWVFGQREWVQLASGAIAAARQVNGLGELGIYQQGANNSSWQRTSIDAGFTAYHALCCDQTSLYALADRMDGFASVIAIDLATQTTRVLRKAGDFILKDVSTPEPLAFKNREGLTTHAWLYMPVAQSANAQDISRTTTSEKPPLLVLSHGGPTSATSPALNPRIQYYTSRGWAVADVNYGGSSGYGRAYRERLRNNWGLVDVHDCEDTALALADDNRVDRSRLAIKGGSAGGYTTLAALTFGDVFAAGASHYGIGDLNALAAETHKFEARYVDGLIPADEWDKRSPINSVDQLSCPVIFFQGSDDAVVPPGQAQAMVAALKQKSLPVAYVEFAGEGHGFRQAKNIQHAAAAEYQFFCRVFGIESPDAQVALTIENME